MSVMRDAFLAGSQSQFLRETAPKLPFVRRSVSRFLPGEEIDDAMRASVELERNNLRVLLTRIGENVTETKEANAVADHYLQLIGVMHQRLRLRPEVSVKLTQLGLDLGIGLCMDNLCRLIEAMPPDDLLWIDMESSDYADVTLELYQRAKRRYPNVGICLQAYLYRTEKDIVELAPLKPAIRLVKGAYKEPPDIAYPKKQDVDENFFQLARTMLKTPGIFPAIATHDTVLIDRIAKLSRELGIDKKALSYTFLYGIKKDEQLRLAREGWDSRVLVSYGKAWFPWFMRRLAERPANVWFVLRNLV
jgi:proline dehydrogenase